MISFATCNVRTAKKFICKALEQEVDFGKTPVLIELIGKDILRVQDPMMHGEVNILLGKKHCAQHDEQVNEAISELKAIMSLSS